MRAEWRGWGWAVLEVRPALSMRLSASMYAGAKLPSSLLNRLQGTQSSPQQEDILGLEAHHRLRLPINIRQHPQQMQIRHGSILQY